MPCGIAAVAAVAAVAGLPSVAGLAEIKARAGIVAEANHDGGAGTGAAALAAADDEGHAAATAEPDTPMRFPGACMWSHNCHCAV